MKKIFCLLSAALLLSGCNFLDFDESSSDYSREDMYLTYSNIQKMLTNIYGFMPNKDIADGGSCAPTSSSSWPAATATSRCR